MLNLPVYVYILLYILGGVLAVFAFSLIDRIASEPNMVDLEERTWIALVMIIFWVIFIPIYLIAKFLRLIAFLSEKISGDSKS